MSKRTVHPVAPAVLVGMVVVVSLQTVAMGSVGSCVLGQSPAMLRSESDRRAMGTWITGFGDAARALQQFTGAQSTHAAMFRQVSPGRLVQPPAPILAPAGPDHQRVPATPILTTRLNLPPPHALL
jgi:hypothetical protein